MKKSQSINNNQIFVDFDERGNKIKLISNIRGQWGGHFVTKPMVNDTLDQGE